MSKIEKLLLLSTNSKDKKSSFQKNDNFLLSLITNVKDSKKLLSLLKDMNITQNELNNLIEEKTIPIKLKKEIKILIDSLKKEENNSDLTILLQAINTPISNNKLEKIVDNRPSLKEEIVKVTKEIVDARIKLNKIILNEKEIKEFKRIKTFKELIEFSNKKKLNISKIILSSFKPKINNKINNIMNNNLINSTTTVNNLNLKKDINKLNTSKNIINLSTIIKSTEIDNLSIKYPDSNQTTKSNLSLAHNTKKTNIGNISDISLKNLIKLNKKSTKDDYNSLEENFNNTISANQAIVSNLQLNIIKAKETIKHFSNNLKEEIENYKPPISKISIELNPKELGKVEVTLIHRGDNLQIQINSNNNAISLFNYNQQELKQNLINMGFSDVNMSFNQQNQQQKENREYQQNQKFKQQDEDELIIEIPYQYA